MNGEATTATLAATEARETTATRMPPPMTPRKTSAPTVTTTDVIVNEDKRITASSGAQPYIAEFRRYKAFKQ